MACFDKIIMEFLFPGGQGSLPVITPIDDKHTHCHSQFTERGTNRVLFFNRPMKKTVVFNGAEALIIHKSYFIDERLTGVVGKLSMMRCVVHSEKAVSILRGAFLCKAAQARTAYHSPGCKKRVLNEFSSFHIYY